MLAYVLVVFGCLAGNSARGGAEDEALTKSNSLGVDELQLQKVLPLLGKVDDLQYPIVKDGKIDADLMGLGFGADRGVLGRLLRDVLGFGTPTNSFLRIPEAIRQVRGWAVQPAFIDFFPTRHPLLAQVAEILGKEPSSGTNQSGTGDLRGKEVTWRRYGDLHFGSTNDSVCVLRVGVVGDRDGARDGKHFGEPNVSASEDAAKKVSTDNPGRLDQPEMVRVSHILLITVDSLTGMELSPEQKAAKHKQMEGLLKRARAGEDFAELVRQYSEDRASKSRGGEYKFHAVKWHRNSKPPPLRWAPTRSATS